MTRRILVTGALGQIGSELVTALRQRHGSANVVASDIRMQPAGTAASGPFAQSRAWSGLSAWHERQLLITNGRTSRE